MTAASQMILVDREGAVATVTINRPDRRNALGTELVRALRSNLQDLADESDVNAVVLTGAGSVFCAGSDLKELGGLDVPDMCAHETETADIVRQIGFLPVPVIAAVEGYALGGGCALALACDMVVTARSAKWAMPEVANGWLPPWGLQALSVRVGPIRARHIVWGAVDMDGEDALRLGMADKVAADGTALAEAVKLAESLSSLPPEAVRSAKRYFEAAATSGAEQLDREATRTFAEDARSNVARTTLARFGPKKEQVG